MSAATSRVRVHLRHPRIDDLWLNSPTAEKLHNRILRLVDDPNWSKPEGMLIVGDPDTGKSHILKHAHKILTAKGSRIVKEHLQIPVLMFDAPPRASLKFMLMTMAGKLHVPITSRFSDLELASRMQTYMKLANVKAIFVDELHNLLSGTSKSRKTILELLKTYSNELGIPVITAGTEEAFQMVIENDQHRNRFRPTRIPSWTASEFVGLVISIEEHFSLPQGCLANPETTELLFNYSEQRIGPTVRLIKNAYDEHHLPHGLPMNLDLLEKVIHEEAEYQPKES